MISGEGREEIIFSSAKGKMRLVIGNKGLELANELGDLKIKCRKLKIGGEGVMIKGRKKVSLASKGDMSIKGENINFENEGGDAVFKGQNIRLHGTYGAL